MQLFAAFCSFLKPLEAFGLKELMLVHENLRIEHSNARLSNSPKHLEDLWKEWEFGVGGRKAAKLFTSSERGLKVNRYRYCRRLKFWKLASEMIRRGHSSGSACNEIGSVYGESLPVGAILEKIRIDKGGNHPRLLQQRASLT